MSNYTVYPRSTQHNPASEPEAWFKKSGPRYLQTTILAEIAKLELQISMPEASSPAKSMWEEFRSGNTDHCNDALTYRVLCELIKRGATLEDLYTSSQWREADHPNIKQCLYRIDYHKNSQQDPKTIYIGETDTISLSDDEVRAIITKKIAETPDWLGDLHPIDPSITFWEGLLRESPKVALAYLEEMKSANIALRSLHTAYHTSQTENPAAIVARAQEKAISQVGQKPFTPIPLTNERTTLEDIASECPAPTDEAWIDSEIKESVTTEKQLASAIKKLIRIQEVLGKVREDLLAGRRNFSQHIQRISNVIRQSGVYEAHPPMIRAICEVTIEEAKQLGGLVSLKAHATKHWDAAQAALYAPVYRYPLHKSLGSYEQEMYAKRILGIYADHLKEQPSIKEQAVAYDRTVTNLRMLDDHRDRKDTSSPFEDSKRIALLKDGLRLLDGCIASSDFKSADTIIPPIYWLCKTPNEPATVFAKVQNIVPMAVQAFKEGRSSILPTKTICANYKDRHSKGSPLADKMHEYALHWLTAMLRASNEKGDIEQLTKCAGWLRVEMPINPRLNICRSVYTELIKALKSESFKKRKKPKLLIEEVSGYLNDHERFLIDKDSQIPELKEIKDLVSGFKEGEEAVKASSINLGGGKRPMPTSISPTPPDPKM
jgi:hypothetical protein